MADYGKFAEKARAFLTKVQEDALASNDLLDPRIRQDNPDILGRDDLADEIEAEFENYPSPIVLHGQGGVGKTATADHYARTRFGSGRYIGVWRVSGESISAAAGDIAALSRYLDVSGAGTDEDKFRATIEAMRARSRNQGKRWLIIHDNVDDEETQRLVLRRFTDEYHIDHLITSRLERWAKRATAIPVPEPGPEAAVALLAREAGRAADEDLAKLALETLGSLPLALLVVGAELCDLPEVSIAAYGTRYQETFEKLPPGDTVYDKSLAAAVRGSFERLGPDAQAVLTLAAFMSPEDIDADYLKKGAAQLPEGNIWHELAHDDARRGLAYVDARRHSLLRDHTFEDAPTLQIHRLTQEVLRDAMGDEARDAVLTIAALAGQAQRTTSTQYDVDNWPRYRRLFQHALALAPLLAEHDGDGLKPGGDFVNSAALFLQYQTGDFPLAQRLFAANLSIMERAYGNPSQNYGAALGNLGMVLDGLAQSESDPEEAARLAQAAEKHLKQALDVTKAALGASDPNVAYDENALGAFFSARDRFEEAESHYLSALEIFEAAAALPELIGAAHGELGVLYSQWALSISGRDGDDFAEKEVFHKMEGLRLTRKGLGERNFDTAACLVNLSVTKLKHGDHPAAKRLAIRAAAIPLAMVRDGKIAPNHPNEQQRLAHLTELLKLIDDNSDPRTLAEADAAKVLEDHAAWEQDETPDWPQ